jgi:alkaline phosphatase
VADVASCDESADSDTADLAHDLPGPILVGGDLAYDNGTYKEFEECWNPPWGRLDHRVYPVPGNHEYRSGGEGYFKYWGTKAGEKGKGYYTFDYAGWRILALNSNEELYEEQRVWIGQQMAGWEGCSLAFWHSPWATSGEHAGESNAALLWTAFYRWGGDLVLTGHDHHYERFGRLGPTTDPDPTGIRTFVVGTGGADLRPIEEIHPGSERRSDTHHGLLELRLRRAGYSWAFRTTTGVIPDRGTDRCRS